MKPLARGYIHQTAFFIALSACTILIMQSHGAQTLIANLIYSISLIGMYGISALYHSPNWSRPHYLIMRKIDHSAIFVLIAGTATPICLLGLKDQAGFHLIIILWIIAVLGMTFAIFWSHGPKWVRSILYVTMGWIGILYYPQLKLALGIDKMALLLLGGLIYTIGALIYAFKWPNPFPRVFGYHEIFHLFIVIASIFHFEVIWRLIA